jgi:hypothetical protein
MSISLILSCSITRDLVCWADVSAEIMGWNKPQSVLLFGGPGWVNIVLRCFEDQRERCLTKCARPLLQGCQLYR